MIDSNGNHVDHTVITSFHGNYQQHITSRNASLGKLIATLKTSKHIVSDTGRAIGAKFFAIIDYELVGFVLNMVVPAPSAPVSGPISNITKNDTTTPSPSGNNGSITTEIVDYSVNITRDQLFVYFPTTRVPNLRIFAAGSQSSFLISEISEIAHDARLIRTLKLNFTNFTSSTRGMALGMKPTADQFSPALALRPRTDIRLEFQNIQEEHNETRAVRWRLTVQSWPFDKGSTLLFVINFTSNSPIFSSPITTSNTSRSLNFTFVEQTLLWSLLFSPFSVLDGTSVANTQQENFQSGVDFPTPTSASIIFIFSNSFLSSGSMEGFIVSDNLTTGGTPPGGSPVDVRWIASILSLLGLVLLLGATISISLYTYHLWRLHILEQRWQDLDEDMQPTPVDPDVDQIVDSDLDTDQIDHLP